MHYGISSYKFNVGKYTANSRTQGNEKTNMSASVGILNFSMHY